MSNQAQSEGEVSLTLYDLESGLHEAILQAMEAQDYVKQQAEGLYLAEQAGDKPTAEEYRAAIKEAEAQLAQAFYVVHSYLESATQKRDRVARFLVHLDSQATLAGDEIRRLQDRKRTLENTRNSLKSHIIHIMQFMGVRKLEGETSTLSLRKAPGHVEVTDLDKLPADLKKTEVIITPMKREIGAALKAGQPVDGASWIEGGDSLVVK